MYSSSPISWPSFKPLAQILFKISSWYDFILIFSRGITQGDNSDKKKQKQNKTKNNNKQTKKKKKKKKQKKKKRSAIFL